MAENRQSCPGVRDGVPGDPRDTVKVELLETQSPEGATLTPAGKTPETGAGPCGVMARGAPQSSGVQERCPVSGHSRRRTGHLSRAERIAVSTWDRLRDAS